MNESLDARILAAASAGWRKVARIVAQVSDRAADGKDFDAIEARIRALVDDGKLEAKGDLSRWRFSEVRRPQARSGA
jgi:uncharacterized protein DUF3658